MKDFQDLGKLNDFNGEVFIQDYKEIQEDMLNNSKLMLTERIDMVFGKELKDNISEATFNLFFEDEFIFIEETIYQESDRYANAMFDKMKFSYDSEKFKTTKISVER